MRGTNHVESWNSEMVQVGSGNNNSCQLMDSKLMDEVTAHNLKRSSLLNAWDMVPSTDVRKQSEIKDMRRAFNLEDKYFQVPFSADLPAKADPIGFEAMLTDLGPADADLLLEGTDIWS